MIPPLKASKSGDLIGPILLSTSVKPGGVAASDSMPSQNQTYLLSSLNGSNCLRDVGELVSLDVEHWLLVCREPGLTLGSAALEAEYPREICTVAKLPVYLQDERLRSVDAYEQLRPPARPAGERDLGIVGRLLILLDFYRVRQSGFWSLALKLMWMRERVPDHTA